MIADFTDLFVFPLLMGLALLLPKPTEAECPASWSVSNLKPDGRYTCDAPLPRTCGEDGQPPCPPPRQRGGRIYCAGDLVPVTSFDARRVACRAVRP